MFETGFYFVPEGVEGPAMFEGSTEEIIAKLIELRKPREDEIVFDIYAIHS